MAEGLRVQGKYRRAARRRFFGYREKLTIFTCVDNLKGNEL